MLPEAVVVFLQDTVYSTVEVLGRGGHVNVRNAEGKTLKLR